MSESTDMVPWPGSELAEFPKGEIKKLEHLEYFVINNTEVHFYSSIGALWH